MQIKTIVDSVIARELENLSVYEVHERASTKMGKKKLLLNILQDSKKHVKTLEDLLKEARELEASFKVPEAGCEDLVSRLGPFAFDSFLSDADFFRVVLEREKLIGAIYKQLSSLSLEESDQRLFHSLAEDESRHVAWAQSHLDLETMNSPA